MAAEPVREPAPAKLNLCLHVIGRRADGYHLLDSVVVFADLGDEVTARPASSLSLTVTGPEASGLAGEADNLMLRAARLIGENAALCLWKELPVASGIGGGSADAAATLRALVRLTGVPCPDPAAVLTLGADVPVCLTARPARMSGIGETLAPLPSLPAIWAVLVNPRQAVPTRAVFAALSRTDHAALPEMPTSGWPSASALVDWLSQTRNDLQAPALAIAPVIADALRALAETHGCLLARMSGSGATCFGLYGDATTAAGAAEALNQRYPRWWIRPTKLQTET